MSCSLTTELTIFHPIHTRYDKQQLLSPANHHNHHEHPPPPISKTLAPAIIAFSRAIEQRAPRAVLDHLLAASRLVTRALMAARRDGTLPGADEVLPALILVIKESNPPGLRSALERVARFRHPRKLQVSEAAYVFTNVASAVHFLETVRDAVRVVCMGTQKHGYRRTFTYTYRRTPPS